MNFPATASSTASVQAVICLPAQKLLKPMEAPLTVEQPVLLAAVLAHEVRNPLTNIKLAAEILRGLVTDDAQKLYLDIIIRASLRVNILVDDLIRKQQEEKIDDTVHSLHRLLNEVLAMAGDRILLKNITVSKDYAAHDYTGPLNRPRMRIALTNIIINAVDAMKEQGGELKLVTKLIQGNYILQVEDNGCGISAADLKHIFTPYFTKKPGGLGIGLAATYSILRANKVRTNVVSAEGTGTKFILAFSNEARLDQ